MKAITVIARSAHALFEAGSQASVKASNGVIHLINAVLIPSAG
jgi:uncharacterized surface protein with fasciclin (FAS1) repeats